MSTKQEKSNVAENDAEQKLEHKPLPTNGDVDSPYAHPDNIKDRPTLSEQEQAAQPHTPDSPVARQESRGHQLGSKHAASKQARGGNDGSWKINIGSGSPKKNLKKYGMLAGLTSAIIGLSLPLLFGFLSLFGLDNLMSNITDKGFGRLQTTMSNRSTTYMQAYAALRAGEVRGSNGKDNVFFRGDRVRTGSGPISYVFDWYRTMRGSKFEAKLAEKGIHFTATIEKVGSHYYQPRPAIMDIDGTKHDILKLSNADLAALDKNDPKAFTKLLNQANEKSYKVLSHKEARHAVNTRIKEVTHWWQFFERRTVRKAIFNQVGIKKWRFFETTRDKAEVKTKNFRNKMISKMLPSEENSGNLANWVRCKARISDCSSAKKRSEALHKAIQRIKTAGNVVGGLLLVEAASSINSALQDHTLSKIVSIARGDQAMELFANLSVAADQAHTGELKTQEMNEMMETLGDYTNGEGYQVMTQEMSAIPKDEIPENKKRKEYCSEENQNKVKEGDKAAGEEFVWLCNDTRIGGKSTARSIEDWYNRTLGAILNPILTIYEGATDLPILKQLTGAIFTAADWIGQAAGKTLMAGLKVMSLDDNAKDLGKLIGVKIMNFLGANLILNEHSPGGAISNWAAQGGTYTAESTARQRGAAATNPVSVTFQNNLAIENTKEKAGENKGLFEKYASLENKESTASKFLLTINDNISSYSLRGIPDFIGRTVASAPQSLLKLQDTSAKEPPSPYLLANFAGIDTFDFPEKCYNYNPLTATPQNGTNIQEILGSDKVPSEDLTWGLVVKSQDWYKYIDEKIGDQDDKAEIAQRIYNCNLLDSSVRSAMGGIFGYSEDDDMPESGVSEDQATLASGDDQALAQQIIDSGKVTGSAPYMAQIKAYASGDKNCNINSTILQLIVSMINAGYSMDISSLNRRCTGVLTASGTASYHYAEGGGHAIDFQGINGQPATGADAISVKFLKDAVQVIPSGSGIGQSNCRGAGKLNLPNGITEFSDSCNHIHIQVPKQ